MISWMHFKRDYRVFEGFRTALTLTFVSGFIDAYTYLTQGQSFAGMQTGNIIYMMLHFARQDWQSGLGYVLPILLFVLGQVFIYMLRKLGRRYSFHWHLFSGRLLFLLLFATSLITPFYQEAHLPIMVLSFYAAVQVETFKKIRGMPYTGIMMTGNIRILTTLLCEWLDSRDAHLLAKARNVFLIILVFMLGVLFSAISVHFLGKWTLSLTLLPLAFVNFLLATEVAFDAKKEKV